MNNKQFVSSTTETRKSSAIGWLLLIAVILRIAAAFAVDSYVSDAGRPFLIEGDANGYWELAKKISAGEEYSIYTPPRRVLRVPGFPLLLSTSICLFGDSIPAARILLALIGAACCWLTYCLGKRLFNRQVGFGAAAYVSLNPIHIGNSVLILSETWFAFWMLLSLLALDRLHRKLFERAASELSSVRLKILISAATTGILIGLTVLVRPGFLPWLIFVVLALVCFKNTSNADQRNSNGVRWMSAAAVIVGFAVTMAPWAIRNYQATRHVVLTSLWSGPSLYDGLNPDADGTSDMTFFDKENVLADMSEFQMNQHYKQKAVEFVVENPLQAAFLAIPKARQYLSPVPNSLADKGWAIYVGCVTAWILLFFPLGVAVFMTDCKPFPLFVTLGPFLLFLLVHMVFVGSVRYRLPGEVPLSVLAAMGWQMLVRKRRGLT